MLPGDFAALLVVDVVLAKVAVKDAVIQVQSNIMFHRLKVVLEMWPFAPEKDAMQAGQKLALVSARVAQTGQGLEQRISVLAIKIL